jgi:hypothetical protein
MQLNAYKVQRSTLPLADRATSLIVEETFSFGEKFQTANNKLQINHND